MKPRKRARHAIETARALLQLARIEEPEDLDVDALAASCDAFILSGALPHEDGRRLRGGAATVIRVREGVGAERTLYTKAHEVGHLFLHPDLDQLARCTGGMPAGDDDSFRYESEANDFATELVLPETPMRARIARDEAAGATTFDTVSKIASWRGASLSATGIRVAELTTRAVAMVHVTRGFIDWAAESRGFLGKVVRGHRVADGTVAARLTKEPVSGVVSDEMRGRSWGTFGTVVEEAVRTDYGSVIAWVRTVS